MRGLPSWRLAPTLAAAAIAALYLLLDPRTGDLAAHLYRADLFDREGFTLWNGNWYAGHHTPAYSVLFPPLAWLLSPQAVGAIAAVAAAALFEPLVHHRFGERAKWGALWFGAAASVSLFTGRLPFILGVAVGLGALLALQRRRHALAGGLALTCSLASPVAGAFLALAALAHELAARTWRGAAVAFFALVSPVALSLMFPEGGYQPFTFISFISVPIFLAVCLLALPARELTLRIGVALYGLATVAAYLVDTPMGNNAVRLAELFGGPVLACVLIGRRDLRLRPGLQLSTPLLVVLLLSLAVWPLWPTVRDLVKANRDPATERSYYEPLMDFLERVNAQRTRVEIPFTKSHFETYEVARRFPIARGWQRQIDIERNRLFYDGVLNDLTYATWLAENAVSYVALPDAQLDFSSLGERVLIKREPSYLDEVWRSEHWRVYEVNLEHPLVISDDDADIRLRSLGSDHFELDVHRPGEAIVRIGWTHYWRPSGGCVEADGHWTRVTATRPGTVRVTTRFSLPRALARGRRCG